MNAVALTVLMPVYDAQEYLSEAIESILNQTYRDFEFLIIDDGSKDKSQDIIEEYAKKDGRIRSISRSNKGLVATLNEGVAKAKGEYIARMDADDVAAPNRLDVQLGFMRQHKDYVVVGSDFISLYSSGEGGRHHCFINDITIRHALPIEGCIPHPSAMFDKQAVLKVGGYRTDYPHAEDYDLWRRLSLIGKLANIPDPLIKYRHSSHSVSYSNVATQSASTKYIQKEIWNDGELKRFRYLSLRELINLPGENIKALRKLQRKLAWKALTHGEVKAAIYLLVDVARSCV